MKAVGNVRCAACGKVVRGYVPRGGDGTGLHAFRHAPTAARAIDAVRGWCPGSYRLGADATDGRCGVDGSAVRR
jgi:hypothetical protein